MPRLYIDLPWDRKHNWSISKNVEEVVRHEFDLKTCDFICNSMAKVSSGDLYEVTLQDHEDIAVFYLRTGVKLISETEAILAYREKSKR